MAGSRIIDKIAILGIILALIITAAFMRGESLGIEKTAIAEESAVFTDNDLYADWDTSGATLITLTGDEAEIDGEGAYFRDGNLVIFSAGNYVLTGTLTDGSVVVDETSRTTGKTWILANGVDVYCSDSAALDIEEADKVFLTLAEGTENSFSSGETYSEDAEEKNIRGAVFSRDDLTINGNGSLTVNGEYRHGIVCNDDLRIAGGSITVTAKEDGIHANDSAVFGNMNLTISCGDDGITVSNDEDTAYFLAESGTISITSCAEGIEAKTVTVDGGDISVSFTDDGINAGGTDSLITINGGTLSLLCENGRDVDGLDSNGDIVINGGTVFVSVNADGMNNALDYGSELGGQCFINGGTVIAAGSTGMAETMSSESSQVSVMYNFEETQAAGQTVELKDSDGTVLFAETIPYSFSSLVLSSPELSVGETCTLLAGGTEYAVEITETSTTIGNAGFGGMGGGFGGPRGGMDGGFGGPRGGNFNQNNESLSGESADSTADGEMQQMPEPPQWAEGEMPEPPQWADGEMPESPQWADAESAGAAPEGTETAGTMQNDGSAAAGADTETAFHRYDRQGHPNGMGGPMQEQQEVTGMTAEELKTALGISGVCLLVLVCGILAAVKIKNQKNIV